MASKKQRSKSKSKSGGRGGAPRSYSNLYKDEHTAPAAAAATSAATTTVAEPPRSSAKEVNWGAEYAYIVGDLRQLIIVSVVVIVVMIAVGFMI